MSNIPVTRRGLLGSGAALGAALKSGELTKGVSFARAQKTPLASILQILRRLTGRHKRVEDRSAPELRGSFNHTVAGDSNVVMQCHVVANDRVRPDNHVASEFCLRADDRCGVNGHFAALLHLFDWSEGGSAADLIAARNDAAVNQSG